jgi:polysaccharide biosynthesis/export protein
LARTSVRTRPKAWFQVIYNIDLHNPNSFFVMQSFAINDEDVLYVANSGATELQ